MYLIIITHYLIYLYRVVKNELNHFVSKVQIMEKQPATPKNE